MKVVVFTISYGRKTLYANINEDTLLSLNEQQQNDEIIKILTQVVPLHESNKLETIYLKNYKKGLQDIYTNKKKHTRPEIDNKTVENWAYAMIDFKKCFLLGKPIQYTQQNDASAKEISILNKYCQYERKKKKDMDIYEDVLTCGRGFRFVNIDEKSKEDEAPFEILNLEPEFVEVVYSSGIRKEQLFAFIETPLEKTEIKENTVTGELQHITQNYSEYTVYLRNRVVTFTTEAGGYSVVPNSSKIIALNDHIIKEYFTNRDRISLIEIGKDLFNDINYLESLDKDDMEQFVNAIMVFTNAEVNEADLKEIRDLGAVSISSTENKQASVTLLEQRLNATDTQTYYTRLLTSLHQILGIPMATDTGSVTSGDTGKAKLTGQGYTMAGIRAEGDEAQFEDCDRRCLQLILSACENSSKSEMKGLKPSEISIKFSRDTSDNLLIKTQGLMNLYQCDIPREIANSVVNLFNDANSVTVKQQELFGDQVSQQGASKTAEIGEPVTDQTALEQNNKQTQVNEIDNQKQ